METIPQVWMAAIKATVAFVMQVEDNNVRGHFLDVLPLLLEVSLLMCFLILCHYKNINPQSFLMSVYIKGRVYIKHYLKQNFLEDTLFLRSV